MPKSSSFWLALGGHHNTARLQIPMDEKILVRVDQGFISEAFFSRVAFQKEYLNEEDVVVIASRFAGHREVRNVVGAQVSVFAAGSSLPTTRGDSTMSTCTYVITDAAGHPENGLGAKLTLTWAPKTTLAETNDFYTRRHVEAPSIKGDVLILAWIRNSANGPAGDWSASQKLIAAVLKKL
jgi:hypothetical protein